MPYEKTSDLPESVRDALPPHAEEIYKEAYNHAYEEYGHDESRAHRVAWGAVKRKYHKDESSGRWVEGPSEDAEVPPADGSRSLAPRTTCKPTLSF